MRPSSLLSLLSLLSLVAASACFAGRSDLVIPPIPDIKIDVPAPIRDTLFVEQAPSYAVMTWRRDDLPAKPVLDEAAHQYQRLFGVAPPQILVFVGDSGAVGEEPPQAFDTVYVAPSESPTPLVDPRVLAYGLVRAWVHASMDSTRAPEWLELGAAALVSYSQIVWPTVVENMSADGRVLPLESLFAGAGQDNATVGAEGASLLIYLSERDPEFVAWLPEMLAKGVSMNDALMASAILPHDLATLEADWLRWLEAPR